MTQTTKRKKLYISQTGKQISTNVEIYEIETETRVYALVIKLLT